MNKQELVAHIADLTGLSRKDTALVIKTLTLTIAEQLAEGAEIVLPALGKFSTTQRAARTGRNPQTGEAVDIPAKVGMKFSPAKALKDVVND